jgi:Domain of unknown function (DUF4399)/Family of unknown function (DUF6130)
MQRSQNVLNVSGVSGVRAMARFAFVATALAAVGCGGSQPAAEPAATPAPAAESAAPHPMAMFMAPHDGDTVKSPVHLMFGVENFGIAAVPAGEVTESRPGMGHYHVGVDADCLPAGTVIPKAEPWVHFGDGKNMIDMQLTPGPHKLTLQVGDDQHTTVEGLCQTINVTVEP